ncbi:ferrochelatase [Synechocystis sp. PCC 6803]|jgi:ferrochelatase|uniref:Ferrochelatase n=1 Tax=Synechocystis sp. (strain ATCC 27184 / PCC 6803 / Kazusa) TaxID=1111708 RepID=HEMH_SYNY3|nr:MULTISPECIES: ferrochelatase [unclassified Synechocystis]P54225.1 RecName: Full=Ferrochelatase; AltName: Full=Heme synthase; AltName: Full=Protoheme ferro-lyase; AltName: Full=Small Cab-like protein ScpA [Synechocystis sp. PCC 6803 substr. Kazusa]BAM53881.1 ferrochelatase [Synechocystis sp. PCC 6803] [Bacillus subtilis BEST7613]AGF52815.1 ferrochelatase [Synechocystis sp. PCC 6803]ALJ68722.1 ferrochelatase [Synechocystis sp. PCC 6803]AVP90578.1 ferrochelatase [Synechocystis sp. IPPAS B-1465
MGRVGVLLLNLGGPEKLEDVRPFLFNLFADPEIIRLPFPWLQKPLAWLISTLRAKKSQANYAEIGGGSPLLQITEAQASALTTRLERLGQDAKVYIGMRYWHPFTEEAVEKIKGDRLQRLVILPLYPHFSISTSGSSFRVLEEMWHNDPSLRQLDYSLIPSWYDHPGYLQAMADLIAQELKKFPNPDQAHIFFSAHGVPQSYVDEAGDPYQAEIEACTRLIMRTLDRPNQYTLAYQSRVGPVEWLKPYTEEALQKLGAEGIDDLLVVPISFVSEHIETLQEIDIEYREIAEEAGIDNFQRVPALNTHPVFIDALAQMVMDSLNDPPCTFETVPHPKKNMKMYPQERWEWGLTTAAEVWNGRLAMLGFIALLVELISGQGPLHFVGLL